MTAISKQALFSTLYNQQRKDDVIVTSFDPDFLNRKIFTLSQSNYVQNLSSLTSKTKELWRGVENTFPWCYTSQKSPMLIGLSLFIQRKMKLTDWTMLQSSKLHVHAAELCMADD